MGSARPLGTSRGLLTSPAARLPSLSQRSLSFSLYSREHRVLETIVDVTAWHFLCKEDKYVGAGGWRKATLKATAAAWARESCFSGAFEISMAKASNLDSRKKSQAPFKGKGSTARRASCFKEKFSLRLRQNLKTA